MANPTVYFLVTFNVHEGKLAAFEETAKASASATRKEPGAAGYEFYLSRDHKTCKLVETYRDPAAALAHMGSAGVKELVPKMLESASIASFEVYGDPGPEARARLEAFGATIYEFKQGLGRQ
jgi:quinol monooxygenase YgiN